MKQPRDEALSYALGDILAANWQIAQSAACLPDWAACWPDLIVPMPMYWSRRWWRGVNSSEMLAERMAARIGVPWSRQVLVSCRKLKKQGTLSTRERFQNVRGAFRVSATYDITGARIMLIDDIMTTGATASAAAAALRRGGAASVDVAVVARGVGRGWKPR